MNKSINWCTICYVCVWVRFLCVCVFIMVCYKFMIIDGVFHQIGHAHLNDQTYDTSEFIHKCSLQGQ